MPTPEGMTFDLPIEKFDSTFTGSRQERRRILFSLEGFREDRLIDIARREMADRRPIPERTGGTSFITACAPPRLQSACSSGWTANAERRPGGLRLSLLYPRRGDVPVEGDALDH